MEKPPTLPDEEVAIQILALRRSGRRPEGSPLSVSTSPSEPNQHTNSRRWVPACSKAGHSRFCQHEPNGQYNSTGQDFDSSIFRTDIEDAEIKDCGNITKEVEQRKVGGRSSTNP